MKIIKITESQYKRLVRVKNLNEQIIYPSMDIETQERHDITPDLKDYLGWLNDTLGYLHNLPLYINKIDSGVVYIDWTKYSEEEKNLIKKYNKEWVDHTKDPKDGVSGNGYYSSGLDWDFEDEPEYVYNPEDWPDETKDDVVIEPEKEDDVVIEPEKTIKTLDINDPTLIKPSSYYGSDRDYGWRDPIPSLCRKGKFRYCKKHWHDGEDYPYPVGTEIYVLQPGVVEEKGIYTLKIKHDDGSKSRYVHCDKFFVSKGDRIESGTLIGTVGKKGNVTGPHLHFEYWKPNDNNTSNPKTIEDKYIRFKKK